jgi:hypothetical protein
MKGSTELNEDSQGSSMNYASYIGMLKIFSPTLFLSLSMNEVEWLQKTISDDNVRYELSVDVSESEFVKQRDIGSRNLGERLIPEEG